MKLIGVNLSYLRYCSSACFHPQEISFSLHRLSTVGTLQLAAGALSVQVFNKTVNKIALPTSLPN